MGIVKKQAFWNSVVNYLGIAIGFLNIVILFPRVFDTDQFGLTRVLIAIATLYMQFSALGTGKILLKFLPFFKTPDKKHRGFLFLGLLIPFTGFLVFSAVYLLFDEQIISRYKEQSALFIDNYYYAVPLAFLMLYCTVLEAWLQAMYRTVLSMFLRQVAVRLLWMLEIVLFHFGLITFEQFLLLFVYTYAVNLLILAVAAMAAGQFHLKPEWAWFRPRVMKLVANYGLFSILSGVSNMLMNRIDIIMIGFLIGLSDTAVYSVAAYIAAVVYVPANSMARIAYPIISEHWKRKRLDEIASLYRKTSITMLLLGGYIFIGIWANIDNVFAILPDEYASGRYVIFFIALAKVFQIATGVNGQIILVSKYYRFDTVASVLLIVIAVLTNLLLIPEYGIKGAAMATAISILFYNIMKFIFVWAKLKMQPFTGKTLLGIAVLAVPLYAVGWLPPLEHFIIDIIVRSVLITAVFFTLAYVLKVSDDLNETIRKSFFRVKKAVTGRW